MDAFAGYVLAEKALDYADAVYYGYLFCGGGICHAFNVCDAAAVVDIYVAGVFLCHSRCCGGRFLYSGAGAGSAGVFHRGAEYLLPDFDDCCTRRGGIAGRDCAGIYGIAAVAV